ncbi:MAG: hypothetical protein WCC08_01545 [Terrimicrobiaceae bacterium]
MLLTVKRLEFMQPRPDVTRSENTRPRNAQQSPWLARHSSDGILKRLQLLEQSLEFAVVPLPNISCCRPDARPVDQPNTEPILKAGQAPRDV